MAAATLRREDGLVVSMPRVLRLTPTAVVWDDGCGREQRVAWSPVTDRLEYRTPEQVIADLEAALARATGRSVDMVRLSFGYDGS
jgi:hypothetical protein